MIYPSGTSQKFLIGLLLSEDIGPIEYTNFTLEEYKAIYPNGTSNNLTKDDFDGAQFKMFLICSYFVANFGRVVLMKFVLVKIKCAEK